MPLHVNTRWHLTPNKLQVQSLKTTLLESFVANTIITNELLLSPGAAQKEKHVSIQTY
jgi:hypothetical protein